jgi:CheY-like chemotaxis protein
MTGVATRSAPAGHEAAVEVSRVLFVDDDERTLSGYRRMLRPYRGDWEMTFVDSAAAPLTAISTGAFDVVVSDVDMPRMDGVELLETVAECHPEIIRIILSGRMDDEATRRATGVAHQYLARPCSAEQLREPVQRSAGIRATLSRPDLIRAVAATKTLPSEPTLYHELTAELRSEDPSIRRVSGIVRRDPGMSAELLQMVKSAFFGLRRRVTDVHQAVTLLGTDTIAALSLSVHVFTTANLRRGCAAISSRCGIAPSPWLRRPRSSHSTPMATPASETRRSSAACPTTAASWSGSPTSPTTTER